jgi:hypothetical protein
MDDEELVAVCCQKMQLQAFRPGQGDVIRNMPTNSPCLAVMPTGGGKTLLWLLTTNIWNNQHIEEYTSKPLNLIVVSTGSRQLTMRDKSVIIRKTAKFARDMEFEGGIRPPTKTSEHIQQSKRSKTAPQHQSSQLPTLAPDESDIIQMRLNILRGNIVASHFCDSEVDTFSRRATLRDGSACAKRFQQ